VFGSLNQPLRWGLAPSWAKHVSIGSKGVKFCRNECYDQNGQMCNLAGSFSDTFHLDSIRSVPAKLGPFYLLGTHGQNRR